MKGADIKQSKLDLHIELFYQLNQQEPQKTTSFCGQLENNSSGMQNRIALLVEQGLVKQTKMGRQVTYQDTKTCLVVLNYIGKNLNELPSSRLVPA